MFCIEVIQKWEKVMILWYLNYITDYIFFSPNPDTDWTYTKCLVNSKVQGKMLPKKDTLGV